MQELKSTRNSILSTFEANRKIFTSMMNDIASNEKFRRAECQIRKYKKQILWNRFRVEGTTKKSVEVEFIMETGKLNLTLKQKGIKDRKKNIHPISSKENIRKIKKTMNNFFFE